MLTGSRLQVKSVEISSAQQQSDFERLATYCLFLQPYLTLWGVKRFSFFIVLTLGCPLALCCLKVLSALCMAQQGIYLISFEGLILKFDGILWPYQVILFLSAMSLPLPLLRIFIDGDLSLQDVMWWFCHISIIHSHYFCNFTEFARVTD